MSPAGTGKDPPPGGGLEKNATSTQLGMFWGARGSSVCAELCLPVLTIRIHSKRRKEPRSSAHYLCCGSCPLVPGSARGWYREEDVYILFVHLGGSWFGVGCQSEEEAEVEGEKNNNGTHINQS